MFKELNARKPVVGNTDYPTKMNALIDDLKNAANLPGLPFSFNESTTAALVLGLFGGQLSVNGVLTTIADGTIALTGATTNYVEHTAAGVVSKNAVGFSADKFPIAEVVTDAGSITGYTDRRNLNTMLIPGRVSIDVAGGVGTTVLTAAQWMNDILEFTGALTGNRTIEVPTAVSRPKVIYNATTGAFTLTVKTNAGTGKEVTQGKRGAVYCDGVNVELAADDAVATGALPLSGGTLTGPLVLDADPAAPLQPATKQYADAGSVNGQCRLSYVSATSVRLDPFNGQRIRIAGAYYDVPSAGVASGNPSAAGVYLNGVANQSLAASTLYYVYAFIIGGTTIGLDFSATAYTADATAGNVGTRIKTTDASRTLVGMIYTNGASQFEDRYVRSWFNDGGKAQATRFTSNPATAGGPVELSTSIRNSMLIWANEVVIVSVVGSVQNSSASVVSYTNINVDGVNNAVGAQTGTFQAVGSGYYIDFKLYDTRKNYSEGARYWSLNGQVSSGTGTWAGITGAGDAELCVTATGVK